MNVEKFISPSCFVNAIKKFYRGSRYPPIRSLLKPEYCCLERHENTGLDASKHLLELDRNQLFGAFITQQNH